MLKFKISKTFNTSVTNLYEAWLDSEIYSNMTGAAAEISNQVGGDFTAWDGYILGKNLELVPNKRIKQSWRTTEFLDQQKDSVVEIIFKELKPNVTEVTLEHTHLTDEDTEYEQGWEDFYFKPMEEYFNSQKTISTL